MSKGWRGIRFDPYAVEFEGRVVFSFETLQAGFGISEVNVVVEQHVELWARCRGTQEVTTMKNKRTPVKKAKHTKRKIKTSSRKAVVRFRRTIGEEIDGCDVTVTNATLDHELPAARGGLAIWPIH
jgi:hypothetical protein